ncbi:hypothetical protein GIB67_037998 [Kingdonia uniflora]|uniref:Uncharacterized protein n=1 Tax=Kingdonia uniflora TaxID=39325 RepID=A0A7J7LHL5_9MAGN|nr:hypothetical protein GIB67_037998 [Kingdonia uniflora]
MAIGQYWGKYNIVFFKPGDKEWTLIEGKEDYTRWYVPFNALRNETLTNCKGLLYVTWTFCKTLVVYDIGTSRIIKEIVFPEFGSGEEENYDSIINLVESYGQILISEQRVTSQKVTGIQSFATMAKHRDESQSDPEEEEEPFSKKKKKRDHKHKSKYKSHSSDEYDDKGEERRQKSKRKRHRNDVSSSSSHSDSDSGSGSESDDSGSDSESKDERRRRKLREKKRRRKERDYEKEKRRRRREKVKEKERKRKKRDKEKKKKGAVTNSWGKYGIIRETDMWNKRPEFTAWLSEVKQVNLETIPNWEEKQMFKQFMEDHNTATFPSKKYYGLDGYHRRKIEKEIKRGSKSVLQPERTVFNDEEQRRLEMMQAREIEKEAEVEKLKRAMQSGMAQDMKEQSRLREEMAYQYKLGNFEAAAAIQRRLDPDVAM